MTERYSELKTFLETNGVIAVSDTGDVIESPAVTTARTSLNDATNRQRELNADRENHELELTKDYGPDSVFRALKGTCVSTDSGEYTYELCWMDQTKQKSRKGGGDTNMGNYVSFGKIVVDEDHPADGRGLGKGERITMKYENGQGCWNGPSRSTTVVMACAEKDEIWKVVEEEKCVYRMEVGTPAVCEMPGTKKSEKDDVVKEEL